MPSFLHKFSDPSEYEDFTADRRKPRFPLNANVIIAAVIVILLVVLTISTKSCASKHSSERKETLKSKTTNTQANTPDLSSPVREPFKPIGRNASMPLGRESKNVGAIDLATFNPVEDLIHFDDTRVWFESDHHPSSADDNDHLVNRAMEWPLRRLVNLLEQKKAKLKIHDTYRSAAANRIHTERSIHCEGRAIDLTAEGVTLSELGGLCWQAGFDYVLHEVPKRSGEHIHASVRRDHALQPFEQRKQ